MIYLATHAHIQHSSFVHAHTSTSRKTIFWWTVQSTASPSSGTIRITREGDKDIWRSIHFTSRTFYKKLVHFAKSEGRSVFFAEGWWPRETRLRSASRFLSVIRWCTEYSNSGISREVSFVSFSHQNGILFFCFLFIRKVEVVLDPSRAF